MHIIQLFLSIRHNNIFSRKNIATGEDNDNSDYAVVEKNELGSASTDPSSLRIVSDFPFDCF